MMIKRFALVVILVSIGCKDKPYQDNVEKREQPFEQVIVPEPAPPSLQLAGVVELGTPVSGATVAAFQFIGRKKGEKIGDAVSNQDGVYALSYRADGDGPVLLVATGGSYRDLATNEMIAVKPMQELQSAATNPKALEKININAWTTMAVARAMANKGFWDASVAELKDSERIDIDFAHVSHFLEGKSQKSINIRRQELLDAEKEKLKLDDPRITLHLTHGALSQLAKAYSEKLSADGVVINVIDIVLALSNDLSDRRFDGRNANDEIVFIGTNQKVSLTSYTMRKDLSEAIYLYARRLRSLNRLSEDDLSELKAVGRIIDSIATDSRPELFPEQERPLPIDITVPEISVRFAGKHKNEKHFATLDGEVVFEVSAKDGSNIERINILAPELAKLDDQNNYGPVTVDHLQNSIDVAIACDRRNEFQSELLKWATRRESVACACFEAIDTSGNAIRELTCFQREEPTAHITGPSDQDVFDRNRLRHGIRVMASASSGAALVECRWVFYKENREAVALQGEGKIEGTTCKIDEMVNPSSLQSGNYALIVKVTDILGRKPKSGNNIGLQIRHDLIRFPPGLAIPLS